MARTIVFLRAFYRAVQIIWKSSKKLAITNIILQAGIALAPLVSLFILKGLIDIVLQHRKESYDAIITKIVLLAAIQILQAVLTQLYQYFQSIQQQLITDYVTAMVIDKAIRVPYNHYENSDYHDTLHLAQHQALYKVPALTLAINQMILQGLNVLLLSAVFITIKWYYFFLFVLIGLPLAYVRWYYSNKTNQLEKQNVGRERQAGYLNLVLTSLGYAKEVRVFGIGKDFLEKFKNIRKKIAGEKRMIGYQNAWAGFWAQLIEIISICYIYYRIAVQTITGVLSVGSFVLYFQAFQRLQASLRNFLEALVQLFQLRLFLNDLFIFLDIQEPKLSDADINLYPGKGIQINDLSFSYPGTEKQVLKNISLDCKPGSLIALVGENGSGKSTLVKLLTGLYDVPGDSILIQGVPVNKISSPQLRKKISVIFQDFNMYDATVAENIALNQSQVEEKIEKSAKASGADDFIHKLPKAYETWLGRAFNKSEQLSGGQWQKLAIARALYRDTDIIILDEPTSHIDPIAEFSIIENLKKNVAGKIIILITHRLYNLKNADYIYTIHEGQITEQGTYSQLINSNGMFREMSEKQKL